ncbi:MAG: C39 family peptidase [Pseudomonadales bacterium]
MKTLRFADTETAGRYPLAVTEQAVWLAGTLRLVLPSLPAGTLLVPSLALPDVPVTPHRWTLSADGVKWPLPIVPAAAGTSAPPSPDPRASGEIDCWRLHDDLVNPTLTLELEAPTPTRYLISVSARAYTLAEPLAPGSEQTTAAPIPPLSQLDAAPDIARRICSPTSLAMLIGSLRAQTGAAVRHAVLEDWQALVAECRDPATGLYGLWPLAIGAAARRGFPGAVEVFESWRDPLAVLARGLPFVASIRFARDALPGAPLAETGGHQVVVAGINNEHVLVFDPAAPSADSVARRYPAAAFTRAWLSQRGAAYILCP